MVSPIVLFLYNRIKHSKATVEALKKNRYAENSDLIIYCDGPRTQNDIKEVQAVRLYAKTISGFKKVSVVERDKNLGLAQSIISGVTEVVAEYGKVIVIEDDIVTSPYFLEFINEALDRYEHSDDVVCINGYMNPTKEKLPENFFIRGADCWGWATWQRGWKCFNPDGTALLDMIISRNKEDEFNFYGAFPYVDMLKGQIAGTNNSWAIRWYASAFLENRLTLYPGKSLVKNIGFDGSGTHCEPTSLFDVDLADKKQVLSTIPVKELKKIRKMYGRVMQPSFKIRIKSRIKLRLKKLGFKKLQKRR